MEKDDKFGERLALVSAGIGFALLSDSNEEVEQCLDNEGKDEKESDFHLTVQDVHRIATLRQD